MSTNLTETYYARAGRQLLSSVVEPSTVTPFTIEVRFLGGLSETQKNAFKAAANRWTRVITGDLPAINMDGEIIDDLVILAEGTIIDGPRGTLGQAGPTVLRPATLGRTSLLPAKGIMSFDTADLAEMESDGSLTHVITHEMGHVLGIGTIWSQKKLLSGANSINPVFIGASARREYGILRGTTATDVPVENGGGPGTRDSHWRDTVFGNELMTGYVNGGNNPLSRVTAACLDDLGYTIDINHAEAYQLPSLLTLGELGLLAAHIDHGGRGIMLSTNPIVLPPNSEL